MRTHKYPTRLQKNENGAVLFGEEGEKDAEAPAPAQGASEEVSDKASEAASVQNDGTSEAESGLECDESLSDNDSDLEERTADNVAPGAPPLVAMPGVSARASLADRLAAAAGELDELAKHNQAESQENQLEFKDKDGNVIPKTIERPQGWGQWTGNLLAKMTTFGYCGTLANNQVPNPAYQNALAASKATQALDAESKKPSAPAAKCPFGK